MLVVKCTEGLSATANAEGCICYHHLMKAASCPPPLAFKLSDAASLLGVSPTSIRRAVKRGLLKPSRAFRHLVFSREELERFLAATTITGVDTSCPNGQGRPN